MRTAQASLVSWLEYDRDLFEPGTIARLADHFRTLLAAATADAELRIADLPMLAEAERRLVVQTWNATGVDYPLDICLHDHIEAQVQRTPEAIALVVEQEVLSYRDLNDRANRLAARLRDLGVRPETLVGICMERSVEMVVGLLGVLKAGGAYVPLDPEYPAERLAFMVADSDPPVLLTQRRHLGRLAGHEWPGDLPGRGRRRAVRPHLCTNPASGALPENLAYVIYTSGSTGKPKGAMNTHRGDRQPAALDAGCLPRWTQPTECCRRRRSASTSRSGSSSGRCMTGARTGGRTARGSPRPGVPVPDHRRSSRSRLCTSSRRCSRYSSRKPRPCNAVSVRRVICSGEALPFELARAVLRASAGRGAAQPVRADRGGRGRHASGRAAQATVPEVVPIGRPIANTRLYVLDDADGSRCRSACPASCTSAASGWGAATWRRPS